MGSAQNDEVAKNGIRWKKTLDAGQEDVVNGRGGGNRDLVVQNGVRVLRVELIEGHAVVVTPAAEHVHHGK